MSLNEVLTALSENEMLDIVITKIETDGQTSEEVPIIEFEASGYEALSTELLEQEVDKIKVDRSSFSTSITILLADNQAP